MMTISYRPNSASFKADPLSHFQQMRLLDPVHIANNGSVILTKYKDVSRVLKSKDVSVRLFDYAEGRCAEYIRPIKDARQARAGVGGFTTLLRLDSPDHERIKRVIMPWFTATGVDGLRATIEEATQRRLDVLENQDTVDLVHDYAYHIAIDVISSILDFPRTDSAMLWEWSESLTRILEPLFSPSDVEAISNILPRAFLYIVDIIEQRRRNPGTDAVSYLLNAKTEAGSLTTEELVSLIGVIYVAGIETTVFLIANSVLSLLKNPSAKMAFINSQARTSEKSIMVDELIRFNGSVSQTARVSLVDLEFDSNGTNKVIPKGSILTPILCSANRDEDVFDKPNELNLFRPNASRHVSFGAGAHYCLGAQLAKLELDIALTQLMMRFPNISLITEPINRDRMTITGVSDLLVRLR